MLTTEFEISLKLKDFFADDFCPVAFFPFLARGLLSGDEMVVGKSRLNLPEWSSTSITAELSFSVFKFEAMKV